MPEPHYAFWDRVTLGQDKVTPDVDRHLPHLGKFGGQARARRRGFGFAMGASSRAVLLLARTPLSSRRLPVIFRRHWKQLLFFPAWLAAIALLFLIFSGLDSHWFAIAWIVGFLVIGAATTLSRRHYERWPLITCRMRRLALLYSSRRFRTLHPESSANPTPEQIAHFLERRREAWLTFLDGVGHQERTMLVASEYPWTVFFPFVFLVPIFSSIAAPGTFSFTFGIPVPLGMMGFYAALFGIPAVVGRRLTARLRRCITDHTCPDCSYPLADFSTGSFRGHPVPNLGPARCNECGAPWPLLPPSAPRLQSKSLFKSFRLFRPAKP